MIPSPCSRRSSSPLITNASPTARSSSHGPAKRPRPCQAWFSETRSAFDELSYIHQKVGAVHVALEIDRNAFGKTRAAGIWIRTRIGNEKLDRAVFRTTNPNTAPGARVVCVSSPWKSELSRVRPPIPRFRVGYVEGVGAFVDIEAAGPAELKPLSDELAVLVEDLNAVVLSITDEQASPRIERQRVDDVELTRTHTLPAPGLDELAVLVEFHDARVADGCAAARVAVADEDVAVRRYRDLGWGVELIQTGSRNTLLTEGQQNLAVLTELEDLMGAVIRHPKVAVFIDGQLVRADEHA